MFNPNLIEAQVRRLLAITAQLAALAAGPLLANNPHPPEEPAVQEAPEPDAAPHDLEEAFFWEGAFRLVEDQRIEGQPYEMSVASIVDQVQGASVRWQKEDVDIPGQHGPKLVLEHVGLEDAGCYEALVSYRQGPDGPRLTAQSPTYSLTVLEAVPVLGD